tara:strand:- start:1088 stop:2383 length:1296 start_codon:yes stop_codon:yes gene_type:complete
MIKLLFFILFFLNFLNLSAEQSLKYYVKTALEKNPKINAEKQNLNSIKENINISKSEFLPSLTLSGSQTSTQSSKTVNQSGAKLGDTKRNTETKKLSIDQKLFQGFKGYNDLKKSKLEVEKANLKFKEIEQEIILKSVSVYFDLIFKNKNRNFNLANLDLFERQVETDKLRLQKGEISLTDLAQSESSLAGANANLIKAETELIASIAEFEKITSIKAPENINGVKEIFFDTPKSLNEAMKLSFSNNLSLAIKRLELAISKKELSQEKASLSPKASINYSVSENKDLSSTIDENEEEEVKATITWPIIKGGKNFSSIKKSKYKVEKNKLLLEDQENELKTQTSNSWSFFQSSNSILASTSAQLKAAEIANEGITLEYDSGNTRTTLEVIQSRSLLLDARISHAKAEKDLVVSKLNLLKQIGGLNLNAIQTP